MDLASYSTPYAYLIVFGAAALEGEVVFVAASLLVGLGRLNPWGVFVAGALGGSAGDQFYFYALRGRLRNWLLRIPGLAEKQHRLALRITRYSTRMMLACRFLPGLRVAIPAACAYAEIPAWRFTTLNLLSSLGWAASIMLLVSWLGPNALKWFGVKVWWGPILPALLMLLAFLWLKRTSRDLS
jgi:membrane protein DedA with SNARE-associated domain